MKIETRELYRSSNGDRWSLAREPGFGAPFVLHEPNQPSGGRPSRIELRDFLGQGDGPQQQELLRLIGGLISKCDEPERVQDCVTG